MNEHKEDFKFRWHEAVTASGLPDKTVRIAVTLWQYAALDGTNARPGYDSLAEGANVSVATVKRHLALLREAGWIKKTSAWTRTSKDVYALVMPEPELAFMGQQVTHDAELIKGQILPFMGQIGAIKGQIGEVHGSTGDPLNKQNSHLNKLNSQCEPESSVVHANDNQSMESKRRYYSQGYVPTLEFLRATFAAYKERGLDLNNVWDRQLGQFRCHPLNVSARRTSAEWDALFVRWLDGAAKRNEIPGFVRWDS